MTTVETDVNTNIRYLVDDASLAGLQGSLAGLNALIADQNELLEASRNRTRQQREETTLLTRGIARLNSGVRAFIAFNISRALTESVGGFVRNSVAAEEFEVQLESLLGTAERAEDAIQGLSSSGIIGSSSELRQTFVQLERLNLDNSIQSLRELSDLSAATGIGVGQIGEALADASVLQFDRLIEAFGIVARQSGDQIEITFDGVTRSVQASTFAVQDFVREFAQSEGIEGANLRRLDTLGGAYEFFANRLSNASADLRSDTLTNFFQIAGATLESLGIAEESVAGFTVRINRREDELRNASEILRLLSEDGRENSLVFRTVERDVEDLIDSIAQLNQQRAALIDGGGRDNVAERILGTTGALSRAIIVLNEEIREIEPVDRLAAGQLAVLDARALINDATAQQTEGFEQLIEQLRTVNQLEAQRATAQANEDARELFDDNLDDARRVAERSLTEIGGIVRDYEQSLAVLSGPAASQALREFGLSRQEALDNLNDQLINSALGSVGAQIIADGTRVQALAIEEQLQRLSDAQSLVGDRADIFAEFFRRGNALAIAQLRDDIDQGFRDQRPFGSVEDTIENLRQNFRDFPQDVSTRISQIARESALALTIDFDLAIDGIGLENLGLIAGNIDEFRRVFGADGEEFIPQATLDQLDQLGEILGVDLNQSLTDRIELLRGLRDGYIEIGEAARAARVQEQLEGLSPFEDVGASTRDLLDFVQNARNEDTANLRLSLDEQLRLYAQSGSDILGIVSGNSERLFEVNRILDASIIATDAAVAVGKVFTSGLAASNPVIAGLQIAGTVATFGRLLQDVLSRDFGDTNINAANAAGTAISAARPDGDFAGVGQGGFVVNILGNVIDTTDGFRDLVVSTTQDAIGRDELRPNDFVTRRI